MWMSLRKKPKISYNMDEVYPELDNTIKAPSIDAYPPVFNVPYTEEELQTIKEAVKHLKNDQAFFEWVSGPFKDVHRHPSGLLELLRVVYAKEHGKDIISQYNLDIIVKSWFGKQYLIFQWLNRSKWNKESRNATSEILAFYREKPNMELLGVSVGDVVKYKSNGLYLVVDGIKSIDHKCTFNTRQELSKYVVYSLKSIDLKCLVEDKQVVGDDLIAVAPFNDFEVVFEAEDLFISELAVSHLISSIQMSLLNAKNEEIWNLKHLLDNVKTSEKLRLSNDIRRKTHDSKNVTSQKVRKLSIPVSRTVIELFIDDIKNEGIVVEEKSFGYHFKDYTKNSLARLLNKDSIFHVFKRLKRMGAMEIKHLVWIADINCDLYGKLDVTYEIVYNEARRLNGRWIPLGRTQRYDDDREEMSEGKKKMLEKQKKKRIKLLKKEEKKRKKLLKKEKKRSKKLKKMVASIVKGIVDKVVKGNDDDEAKDAPSDEADDDLTAYSQDLILDDINNINNNINNINNNININNNKIIINNSNNNISDILMNDNNNSNSINDIVMNDTSMNDTSMNEINNINNSDDSSDSSSLNEEEKERIRKIQLRQCNFVGDCSKIIDFGEMYENDIRVINDPNSTELEVSIAKYLKKSAELNVFGQDNYSKREMDASDEDDF